MLWDCLFGAVKFIKNVDKDKNGYSSCFVGFSLWNTNAFNKMLFFWCKQ